MKKPKKTRLIVVAAVIVVAISLLAWAFGPKVRNMKAEYVTASVIGATRGYVGKTRGQWPRC